MLTLDSYASILYTDTLQINRYKDVDNDDGTTGRVLDPSKELMDIPCHISSVKPDERDLDNWEVDEVMARVNIFLSPKTKVYKGDEVIVRRCLNGKVVQTYRGFAGDPMLYNLAQQFILLEKRVKSNEL